MAIFGALSIARSGLMATSSAMNVVGDNIANVNTVGFKGSRATFADLFKTQFGGAGSLGTGTSLAAISSLQTQGGIDATGRATDVAIDGNGFFLVQNGDTTLYTRAGNFQVDADGNLVTFQGLPVLGFALDADGAVTGSPVPVQLSGSLVAAEATANVDVQVNLDANTAATKTFSAPTTPAQATAQSDYQTDTTVYDEQGSPHRLHLYFTKTGASAWSMNVGVDNSEIGATPADGLTVLTTTPIDLTFNPNGSLNTQSASPAQVTVTFPNPNAPQTITLNLGTPNPGNATPGAGLDGVTQTGAASGGSTSPDGRAAGALRGVTIGNDGTVTGVFDNGSREDFYRLAVATFNAPEQLDALGNMLYQAGSEAGDPSVGVAGSGGRGNLKGGALENSNVDLAQQFIDLITLQRSFQANSRVITSSDEMLSELMNIVR